MNHKKGTKMEPMGAFVVQAGLSKSYFQCQLSGPGPARWTLGADGSWMLTSPNMGSWFRV